MILIGILIAIAYSVFYIAWPEKARDWFLKGYKVDDQSLWYKPTTWLTVKPGILAFRIVGLVMLMLTFICLYFWIRSNGLSSIENP